MKKLILIVIFCVLLFSQAVYSSPFDNFSRGGPIAPRIISPYKEEINLSGQDYAEFKWDIYMVININYTELKIYKGYHTYGDNLIFKERIQSPESLLKVKSDLFDNGEVYTLVLKVVSYSGTKSDDTFCSFRVVK